MSNDVRSLHLLGFPQGEGDELFLPNMGPVCVAAPESRAWDFFILLFVTDCHGTEATQM
jgi:hypothetical protein